MDSLLAARLQMAFSLGFHIIFACVGMAMPFLMAYSEWKWLKTKRQVYKDLAVAWSKGVALFFAIGAVSGTFLSYELGLLWPTFMEHAGPIIGMPFSLEGTAFFIEAIFLGIFLYGWNKVSPWMHWFSGLMVGIAGLASGVLVIAANGWMNAPSGFDYHDGVFSNIDPVAAMLNDAWLIESAHMLCSAFTSVGIAIAGIHTLQLIRKGPSAFHLTASKIAFAFAAIFAFTMPITGDLAAKRITKQQPAKLAAMEAHFHTEKNASFIIGGIPDIENERVDYAIKIPGLLSFLAHGDFESSVTGLEEFPEEERPPVAITHYAFQIMIGLGSWLMLIGGFYFLSLIRKKDLWKSRLWLWIIFLSTSFGFIAVEAGWTVTEVGRQPWIIYGIMKTEDALTPVEGIEYSFYVTICLYTLLSVLLFIIMRKHILHAEKKYASAKNIGL